MLSKDKSIALQRSKFSLESWKGLWPVWLIQVTRNLLSRIFYSCHLNAAAGFWRLFTLLVMWITKMLHQSRAVRGSGGPGWWTRAELIRQDHRLRNNLIIIYISRCYPPSFINSHTFLQWATLKLRTPGLRELQVSLMSASTGIWLMGLATRILAVSTMKHTITYSFRRNLS